MSPGRFKRQRPFWACACGYTDNFKEKAVFFQCKAPRGPAAACPSADAEQRSNAARRRHAGEPPTPANPGPSDDPQALAQAWRLVPCRRISRRSRLPCSRRRRRRLRSRCSLRLRPSGWPPGPRTPPSRPRPRRRRCTRRSPRRCSARGSQVGPRGPRYAACPRGLDFRPRGMDAASDAPRACANGPSAHAGAGELRTLAGEGCPTASASDGGPADGRRSGAGASPAAGVGGCLPGLAVQGTVQGGVQVALGVAAGAGPGDDA